VLTPLTRELADEVAGWFVDDDEGRRRLDADFYGGVQPRWWTLVQRCANRYGWVGLAGDEHVGFVDMEVVDEEGSLTMYIRPAFRRRGLGTALLRLAAVEARAMNVPALVGHAESDYVASIRCLVAAGFLEDGRDDYGPCVQASADRYVAAAQNCPAEDGRLWRPQARRRLCRRLLDP
jgi:GNAT superfamily N-acetyltransferase